MQLRPPATFPHATFEISREMSETLSGAFGLRTGRCGASTRLCARLTLVRDAFQFDPQAIVEAFTVLTAVVVTTHQI